MQDSDNNRSTNVDARKLAPEAMAALVNVKKIAADRLLRPAPRRHHPPPGLVFGEPDDRPQRMIQYAAPLMLLSAATEYWMPRLRGA
jgi:hypothetical protein